MTTTIEAPPTVALSPAVVRQWCERLTPVTDKLGRIDRRLVDPIVEMAGRMNAVGAVTADRVNIGRGEPLLWQAQFLVTARKVVERAGAGSASDVLLRLAEEIGAAVGRGVAR